jgi:3-oxoacyl-[acyl-carrier protein] reductase
MELRGKIALVTGASRGIGRATAIALGRAGAEVIVNYHQNSKAAAEVVEVIEAVGGEAMAVQADVFSPAGVAAVFSQIEESFGKLDILVNNAAVAHLAPLDVVTLELWNKVVSADLTGPFLCIQAAARLMIPKKYGRIVNISSIGAIHGIEVDPAYAAAKAGLLGLTRSTARALGRHNITVNCVCPGLIETDMSSHLPHEARTYAIGESALHRIGVPEDVADVILFFASDYSRHVTGQTILADGGVAMP